MKLKLIIITALIGLGSVVELSAIRGGGGGRGGGGRGFSGGGRSFGGGGRSFGGSGRSFSGGGRAVGGARSVGGSRSYAGRSRVSSPYSQVRAARAPGVATRSYAAGRASRVSSPRTAPYSGLRPGAGRFQGGRGTRPGQLPATRPGGGTTRPGGPSMRPGQRPGRPSQLPSGPGRPGQRPTRPGQGGAGTRFDPNRTHKFDQNRTRDRLLHQREFLGKNVGNNRWNWNNLYGRNFPLFMGLFPFAFYDNFGYYPPIYYDYYDDYGYYPERSSEYADYITEGGVQIGIPEEQIEGYASETEDPYTSCTAQCVPTCMRDCLNVPGNSTEACRQDCASGCQANCEQAAAAA